MAGGSHRVARLVSALFCAAVTASSTSAGANGKFPAAGQFVVDPGDPTHLVARTTFGMLSSRDSGANWDLVCEQAVGYQDYEPPVALDATGSLFVGLYEGVSISHDGCYWQLATGVDLVVPDLTSNGTAVAALSVDGPNKITRYLTSNDRDAFSQVGEALPDGFVGLTLELAPSDPTRLYVSGVHGVPAKGALARSNDGGEPAPNQAL